MSMMTTPDQTGFPEAPPHVAVVGLPYSENVGDGVIADCIDWCLTQDVPGLRIDHIDLAGRSGPGHRAVAGRSTKLALLAQAPVPLRRLAVRAGISKLLRGVDPVWTELVSDADLVLISGGQLFSDADLNFPLKVGRVAQLATRAGVPVSIAAAGASSNWTETGRRLFRELLAGDLRFVGLRDRRSMRAWTSQFADGPEPELVRDPGLLARFCYPADSARAAADRPIGVAVTGLDALAHHADTAIAGAGTMPSDGNLLAFYRGLVIELADRGLQVRLLCNGAAEDQAAVDAIASHHALAELIAGGRVEVAPTPQTGGELAHIVAPCAAVIAHRLHACILAYSYRVPIVGLSWDSKLDAFFESVDLEDLLISDPLVRSAAAADLVEIAIAQGIDHEAHTGVIKECRSGLQRVWRASGLLPQEAKASS